METTMKVIDLGGHQYLVKEGQKLTVNRLKIKEGETLELKDLINKEPVEVKLIENKKGEKIHGMTYRAKTRNTRRYGHRQLQSVVEVTRIGAKAQKAEAKKAEQKTTEKVKKTTVKRAPRTSAKKADK